MEKLHIRKYISKKIKEKIDKNNRQWYHPRYCPNLVTPTYLTNVERVNINTNRRLRNPRLQFAIVGKILALDVYPVNAEIPTLEEQFPECLTLETS